jgi:hypothetical protein
MTEEDALINAIRQRTSNPATRIDLITAGIPRVFEVATNNALNAAEAEMGLPLPLLLKRLYLELANGGFGPGAGLIGVENGHTDPDGRTISRLYLDLRSQGWPQNVLPVCDLGDGARSCVDMRSSDDSLLTVTSAGITRTKFNVCSWLDAWVSGSNMEAEIFETTSTIINNPFTRKPHPVKLRGRAKGDMLESFLV